MAATMVNIKARMRATIVPVVFAISQNFSNVLMYEPLDIKIRTNKQLREEYSLADFMNKNKISL